MPACNQVDVGLPPVRLTSCAPVSASGEGEISYGNAANTVAERPQMARLAEIV